VSGVKIVDNFLSMPLLEEIHEHIVSSRFCWAHNDGWDEDLRVGSIPIAIADLTPFREKIIRETIIHFPEAEGLELSQPMFYSCPQMASIGWHEDYYPLNISVYLNEYWDRQWGGFFLHEDDSEIKAIKPEFNKAVMVSPGIQHCVTQVAHFSPVKRFSIQLFFTEKEKK
jgi:hypothetical protein